MRVGITGSLSSGKSSVAKILSKNKKLLFSADEAVKDLYFNKNFRNKVREARCDEDDNRTTPRDFVLCEDPNQEEEE